MTVRACRLAVQRALEEQSVRASAERRRARLLLSSDWTLEAAAAAAGAAGAQSARSGTRGDALSHSAAGSLRLTLVSEIGAAQRRRGGAGLPGAADSPAELQVRAAVLSCPQCPGTCLDTQSFIEVLLRTHMYAQHSVAGLHGRYTTWLRSCSMAGLTSTRRAAELLVPPCRRPTPPGMPLPDSLFRTACGNGTMLVRAASKKLCLTVLVCAQDACVGDSPGDSQPGRRDARIGRALPARVLQPHA
jgi:hypothetical protein